MEKQAVVAIVVGAILFGSSGVFISYLSIPATSMAFIRMAVPTILMVMIMLGTGTAFFRGNYKLMLAASSLNAARMYCFFTAYIFTSIGNAIIISYTWPIFATLFGILILKEKIAVRNRWLLGTSFLGIMIVYANKPFTFADRDFVGMTAALGAAAFHALGIVIFKKESPNFSRSEIIFYQNFLGSLIFLPFIILNVPTPTTFDWSLTTLYAFLMGVVGFNLFFFGLKHLKASTSSMLMYVEVISALFFSVFWMHEAWSWNMLVGGGIIIACTLFLRK